MERFGCPVRSEIDFTRYVRLIEHVRNTPNDSSLYTESHHIVPKSMGGSDRKSNLIRLTAKQHYIAHLMLWRAFRNAQMTRALHFMSKNTGNRYSTKYVPSKVFEAAREEFRTLQAIHRKGNSTITEAGRKRLSKKWTGVRKGPKSKSHVDTHRKALQKFWYVTPNGKFESSTLAAKACGISHNGIIGRCITRVDKPVQPNRMTPQEWNGKTWRELGYYTEPLQSSL